VPIRETYVTDKFTDPIDIACEQEDFFRQEAIRRQALASAQEYDPEFDGVHCIACDDDIPDGRLLLGKIRCITCQEIKERRRR
jgi:RNA polymerase-binding transcription factor DksA